MNVEAPTTPRRSTRLMEKALATTTSPMAVVHIEEIPTQPSADVVSRSTQTERWTCDRGVQVVWFDGENFTTDGRMTGPAAVSPVRGGGDFAQQSRAATHEMLLSPTKTIVAVLATPSRPSARGHDAHDEEPMTPLHSLVMSSLRSVGRHLVMSEVLHPSTTRPGQSQSGSGVGRVRQHSFLTPTPLMSPSVQRSLKRLSATPVRGPRSHQAAWSTPRTPENLGGRRPMDTVTRSAPRRSYAERARLFDEACSSRSEPQPATAAGRERRQSRRLAVSATTSSGIYSWLADKEKRTATMLKSAMRDIAQKKKQQQLQQHQVSPRERRVSWGSTPTRRSPSSPTTSANATRSAAVGVASPSRSRSLLMVTAALRAAAAAAGHDHDSRTESESESESVMTVQCLSNTGRSPASSPTSSMNRLSLF